jgi:hypothetical protein
MNVKMLQPKCEESKRLVNWVEGGERPSLDQQAIQLAVH